MLSPMRFALIRMATWPVALVACGPSLGCGAAEAPGQVQAASHDSAVDVTDDGTSGDATLEATTALDTREPEDTQGDPTELDMAPEVESQGSDADMLGDLADSDGDDADRDDLSAVDSEASDATSETDAPDAGCMLDSPCLFAGYLPFCYEARCNDRDSCVAHRIVDCCLADVDCAPSGVGLGEDGDASTAGPCATVRCLQNTCTTLAVPGCCDTTVANACDDGTSLTTDACDPVAARCTSCAPACGFRPPIFAATFDGPGDTPAALGFFVEDPQTGDAVSWQRTGDAFAAGGGAVYLGDPRCRTYYGGALDAACEPVNDTGQDSGRIVIGLLTPFVTLPPESPALLTAWLRAAVEPLTGLGSGEPDVLRVQVETLGAQATIWAVASSLDVGKSTDWVPIAVDLAPWRGQTIRLRFDFDTLDGESNRFEGVWLDEIEVREACSDGGCCDDDTDCAGPDACTQGACLLTSQGSARVCETIARSPGLLCTPCASDASCADADPCTHDVCLPSGACGNETFCCLERDLLAEPFDVSLGAILSVDDNAADAVAWSIRDAAAWFGDATTGTYGSAGRVSGALVTPPVALPSTLPPRSKATLTLTVRLSTEWDLADAAALGALDNPAGLDRLTIEVRDTTFVTEIWSSNQIGGTTGGAPFPLELDLTPWLGRTIVVQVRFDSGDETLNAFAGPFIDALALGLRCD